jgi:iron complex outermembrane receptor protein
MRKTRLKTLAHSVAAGERRAVRGVVCVVVWVASPLAGGLIRPAGAAEQTVEQPATSPAEKAEEKLQEVIVTGSRIARPEAERLEPTTVLTSDYLDRHGITNVMDALGQLPQFGQSSGSVLGLQSPESLGQSFASLYSLGSRYTLVLVDGRRFVSADSPSPNGATGGFGGNQVDLGAIPTQLIDRIETISVGGAPVYGADAVAGTVNIILKHNFQGTDLDAQGSESGRGDAGQWRLRTLIGRNFDDGRGNVTLNAELLSMQPLNGAQRSRIADDLAFVPPLGPSPYEFVLAQNVRLTGDSTMVFPPLVADGYLGANPNLAVTNAAGQPLAFQNGHLVPYSLGQPTADPFHSIGGDGWDLGAVTPLRVAQERINATALGNFQLRDDVRLFGELWFSDIRTNSPFNLITVDSARTGFAAGQPEGNLAIQLDNPFLSAPDRAIIAQNLAAFAAANPANPQQPTQFYLPRDNQDIGNGSTTAEQHTRRAVLGIDGSLALGRREVNYEIYGSYGETRSTSVSPQPNFTNLQNALNAIVGPGGQIICNPLQQDGKPIVNSSAPTESSNCAPFNPFGFGLASTAALAYVTSLATETSTLTQRDFSAIINGPLFDLPAGAIKAALGYENRRQTADYTADQFLEQDAGFYVNVFAPFVPVSGAYLTNEAFAELLVPLVGAAQSIPGIRRFEIEAAGREVDHSVAGKLATWTLGARLEPAATLQLRGNYTRSLRAPSITQAYLPTTTGTAFAPDPCDQANITSGPNPALRAANCTKAGVVQPFSSNIGFIGVPSVNVGNPDLHNEIADSRALGLDWRPLERLRGSIDYVQIDIDRVIAGLGAQDVLDACYDSPSYPNSFCRLFARNAAGQITFLQTGYANLAHFSFNGIQTELQWSLDVPCRHLRGGCGVLDLRVDEFFLNRLRDTFTPGDTGDGAGILGTSKHKGLIDLAWRRDRFYADWQASVIGRAVYYNNIPANFSSIAGVGAWWLNNLSVGFQPEAHLKLQLMVDNVFNKQAPYPLPAYPFSGGFILDAYFPGLLGRNFGAQVACRY